ncbi:MAG: hypothetical protein F6K62_26145 [Sphaerospermopsis sp. SIO1G2]|nr:hypothetical protein [Sphaerospermopsis sp. SIO1G2]
MKGIEAAGGRRITMCGMRLSFASNLLIAGVSDVKYQAGSVIQIPAWCIGTMPVSAELR